MQHSRLIQHLLYILLLWSLRLFHQRLSQLRQYREDIIYMLYKDRNQDKIQKILEYKLTHN